MEILRYILILVEVITCLLLIGVILLQQAKSQGMGVAFGGGMGETLFGSRAGNILTKTTITLSIIFLANTALLGIMYTSKQERSLVDSAVVPSAPSSGPVAGGDQVPPPTQQGTLFTPDQAPAPAPQVETVPIQSETVLETTPAPVEAAPAVQAPEPEPVTAP